MAEMPFRGSASGRKPIPGRLGIVAAGAISDAVGAPLTTQRTVIKLPPEEGR